MNTNWRSPIDDKLYTLVISGSYEDFILDEVFLDLPDKKYKIIMPEEYLGIGLTPHAIDEAAYEIAYDLEVEFMQDKRCFMQEDWEREESNG